MGCCSSRSASVSVSADTSPGKASNANAKPPHRDEYSAEPMAHIPVLNDFEDEESEEVSRPTAFANNQSIANEVMRLEEFKTDPEPITDNLSSKKSEIKIGRRIRMEIKTNENSEEYGFASSNTVTVPMPADQRANPLQATLSPSYERDRYHPNKQQNHAQRSDAVDFSNAHPFGLVETHSASSKQDRISPQQQKQDVVDELLAAEKVDIHALYAENLKGFDADKFRTANVANKKEARKSARISVSGARAKSPDDEFSSFTSSEMSSKSILEPIGSARGSNQNKLTEICDFNDVDTEDEEEEDDHDLLMQELSQEPHSSNYKGYGDLNANEETVMSHLDSFQDVGAEENNIKHIMDDEDEELMDAILSLDLDD